MYSKAESVFDPWEKSAPPPLVSNKFEANFEVKNELSALSPSMVYCAPISPASTAN